MDRQLKKGAAMLVGVIDPDWREELWWLLHNEVQGEVYLEFMGFVGQLFMLRCSVVLVNEQFHHSWPNKGKASKGVHPSLRGLWFPRPVKMLTERESIQKGWWRREMMTINYGSRRAIAVGTIASFTNLLPFSLWGEIVADHQPEEDSVTEST